MSLDLEAKLPAIFPKVIRWAEATAARIAEEGTPLSGELQAIALRLGVAHPERIRTLEVMHLPHPQDDELCQACFATGMLGANMNGLTLGYSILVRSGCATPRLLAHNFRHVYQFEEAGSLAAFLEIYLTQMVIYGHNDAPLEWDARQQEKFSRA